MFYALHAFLLLIWDWRPHASPLLVNPLWSILGHVDHANVRDK